MNEINVLDSETVDKIAAGEVVERPGSVVKELVENAIDAGASAITVEIQDGGIEFIRVTDNGSGIHKSQIDKAFLRHATSKIATSDDLFHIHSLGFRGEALSSIAAVSKVELITKTPEELTGIRYQIEGGIQKNIEEIGAPNGTTFLIRTLFYNTPARRKFLKTAATEGGYIADLMERFALSHPDISIQFMVGKSTRFSTSGNGNLREIIYRIYGKEIADELLEVRGTTEYFTLTGFLGKPIITRSNRNFENFFVNGRYIKSELLCKALETGYAGYLMQHKYPFAILNLQINSEKIDVNVHPNKMDIRFSDQQYIYEEVLKIIEETVSRKEYIPSVKLGEDAKNKGTQDIVVKSPEPFEVNRRIADAPKPAEQPQNEFREEVQYESSPQPKSKFLQDFIQKRNDTKVLGTKTANSDSRIEDIHANIIKEKDHIFVEKHEQMNLFDEKILNIDFSSQYKILGQVFDTYWILSFQDKVLFIDQHAAHEKVKYEEMVRKLKEKKIETQILAPPIILRLTSNELAVYEEYKDSFAELGFTVEDFGGEDYAIRTVPMDLYGYDEKEMFLSVLDELYEKPIHTAPEIILEKLASMSCKAAVKGNMQMNEEQARVLIEQLLKLDNPYNCPHGRPVIISMTKYEMEKKFKRIV